MGNDVLNPRRAPRVPARYTVELRHRFSSWAGETEDVGPAGCQIVTPRMLSRGRDVHIKLRADGLDHPVKLEGRVVWTRPEEPARIGVAFSPSSGECGWFDKVLAADPVAARILARTPERLPGGARLFLGVPPIHLVDFSADELAVLRAAAGGLTVESLSRALGEAFERARGALFSLVARRFVVLDAVSSVPAHRWRHVIGDVAHLRQDHAGRNGHASREPRPRVAQVLYDEGVAHLNAGRLGLAVERFREALENGPGDEVISGAMQRLGPWAG